jgi:hypothetical protein
MTKSLLKVKDASASSNVVDRERVSVCMEASLRRIESKTPAQLLDIAENVATAKSRPVSRHDDERVFRCNLLPSEEVAPEFE